MAAPDIPSDAFNGCKTFARTARRLGTANATVGSADGLTAAETAPAGQSGQSGPHVHSGRRPEQNARAETPRHAKLRRVVPRVQRLQYL